MGGFPLSCPVDTAGLGMNEQSSETTCENRLMTDREAADFLRITRRQLFDWRRNGLIPYIKIGKAVRYRKAEILSALERMSRGGV